MDKNIRQHMNIIKIVIIVLMLTLQLFVLYAFLGLLNDIGTYSYIIVETIGILIALKILGSNMKYIYKLSWTVFLVVIPVTAIAIYLLYGDQRFIKRVKREEKRISSELNICKIQNVELTNSIENKRLLTDVNSIYNLSQYPVYQSNHNQYFRLGEEFFKDMLEKLESAEEFIIIEFFIVARGQLLDAMMDVLKRKAEAGVEVYFIYDKWGSVFRFNENEEDYLKASGVKVKAFNDQVTKLYRFINYRTHRKIVVIDGKYTYTGGNNIADEYVNLTERFGHWKDMGIRIEGASSNNFTYAFFKSWVLLTGDKIDINKYLNNDIEYNGVEDKLVVPFTDEPTNDLEIASHNYMRIINNSTDYVYITTPYLIIDEEMISSLKIAAKSGVDVRIIIPGIADKKFVYEISMAHCYDLITAGVKIYKYTPGFIHGKTIVSDDMYSTVGSVNFDYRSLMWNYECAVYAYDRDLASEIKADFEAELAKSVCINEEYLHNRKFITKILNGVYRLIGPLF